MTRVVSSQLNNYVVVVVLVFSRTVFRDESRRVPTDRPAGPDFESSFSLGCPNEGHHHLNLELPHLTCKNLQERKNSHRPTERC